MKFLKLQQGLFLATILLVSLRCSAQEMGAFEDDIRVSFDSKAPESSDVPSIDYDFGEVDQLDDSPSEEQQKNVDAFKGHTQYLVGKKHTFFLYNHGKKPVEIVFADTGCLCLTARVPEGDRFFRFPRTIPAGGKLPVVLAFNWETVASGTFRGQVDFLAGADQDVVASMNVTAKVRGGVKFNPPSIDFGKFASGSSPVRHATLTIDKRLTDHLLPNDTLQLASSSKDFTVEFDKEVVKEDVKVAKDSIHFKDRLLNNLTCAFTVKVASGAPLGTLISKITLTSIMAPNLLVVDNLGVPVRAVQVGHMKPVDSDVINFGAVDPKSNVSRRVNIACALPVLPSKLKVNSSSSEVAAEIVAAPAKGDATSPPSNIATLEVKINPNAKLGQRNAILFVTNPFNHERLKFRVYSTLVNR